MNRVLRVLLTVAVLCFGLGAVASGATAKPAKQSAKTKTTPAGKIESSFGKGGKVTVAFPAGNAGASTPKYTLPFEFIPGHLQMAKAPEGKIVVAGANKIVRYLEDGKLDKTFGKNGTVAVPQPTGYAFVLASVAVDSQGRIVLAGLARPLPSNSAPDPLLSSAAVMRFDANGSLDPTFGDGGMLITDFGLGAPKTSKTTTYFGASVGLRDVVVDSQDRPVVSGAYVTEIGSSKGSAESEGFVARLTASGALDPTFGTNGMRMIETLITVGTLAPRGSSYLALAERAERPYELITSFDENGNLDTGFGSFGFRYLGVSWAPTLAIAPSGKILLLGHPEEQRAYRYKKVKDEDTGKIVKEKVRIWIKVQTVGRLLPSGAGDPSFGKGGEVTYKDPKGGSYAAVTTDGKERVYIAGRISKSPGKKGAHRTKFLLQRLKPNGGFDKSFGKKGSATADFGRTSSSFATQVMLDAKGRVLVGGGVTSPQFASGGGWAIARFSPGK